MEKYSIINIHTNELIKFNVIDIGDDCGNFYFFSESIGNYWIVDNKEDAEQSLIKYKSYIYNNRNRPSLEDLNEEDYKIVKLEIKMG